MILLILAVSCESDKRERILPKYKGYIVVDKNDMYFNKFYELQSPKGKIKPVSYYSIDDHFNIGDTIK